MKNDLENADAMSSTGVVRGEQTDAAGPVDLGGGPIPPRGEMPSCPTCGHGAGPSHEEPLTDSYVYALGRVVPRFPSLGIEKEFAQVAGRAQSAGLTERAVLHEVLVEHRYLAHEMCWVFAVEGIETYLLQPRDSTGVGMLVEAIRPAPSPLDIDVVVGVRGPLASPSLCNGLSLPIVGVDQLYSFDREALIKAIPRPPKVSPRDFVATATDLFDRVAQMADNAGATDEHRALNYCVVRYSAIYASVLEAQQRKAVLSGLEVRPSRLAGARKIVDVILSFTNRGTDVTEKYFARVDVTEKFPFLVSKLAPYYDR